MSEVLDRSISIELAVERGGPAYSRTKRFLDIVLALGLLMFLAPLLVVIACSVALSSPGPVLFRQRRAGLNNEPFLIYKFRTMRVEEDGDSIVQACRNDCRVTAIGGWLRRSSLDELPQLVNVIRGEMSLVGPRPHALAHDRQYAPQVRDYTLRLTARPGMTGLAQVNGCRGETRSVEDMQRRVDYDNRYIRRWSPLMDIGILLKTALIVPFQSTAY